jgi:hypothetical protein
LRGQLKIKGDFMNELTTLALPAIPSEFTEKANGLNVSLVTFLDASGRLLSNNATKLAEMITQANVSHDQLEAQRKAQTKPILDYKKEVDSRFSDAQKPFVDFAEKGKQLILELRKSEQAEADRIRRQAAEAQRLAEFKASELAKNAQAEAESAKSEAEFYREMGNTEMAASLEAEAEELAAQATDFAITEKVVTPEIILKNEKIDSTVFKVTYEATVNDASLAIDDILSKIQSNPALKSLLKIDEKELKVMAKAMKEHLNISGISIRKVESVATARK